MNDLILSLLKISLIMINYIILNFIIIIFCLANIEFTPSLGVLMEFLDHVKTQTDPNADSYVWLGNFITYWMEQFVLLFLLLGFIILLIDYHLCRIVNNNRFTPKDIRIKNRILRLNKKAESIQMWPTSLMVGISLFAWSYQLGPDEIRIIKNSVGAIGGVLNG